MLSKESISHIEGQVYFVSDSHLGVPNYTSSLEREKKLVKWLDEIKSDATHLFLLGDIFDFWFEYKKVIPKGYTRLLGKLSELSDKGIKIYYFIGNHDMWIRDYFANEIGCTVFDSPQVFLINGKKVFIAHGDGLGPRDCGYKIMKKIFSCKFNKWIYARLHPNFAIWFGHYLSRRSRAANAVKDEVFVGETKEFLILFAREKIKTEPFDYFIFGHRHLAMEFKIDETTTYINTGDWVRLFSYAKSVGDKIELNYYKAD